MAATWCSFLGSSSFAPAASVPGTNPLESVLLSGTVGPHTLARSMALLAGRKVVPDLRTLLLDRGLSGAALEDFSRFESLLRPRICTSVVGRCVADDRGGFAVAVYDIGQPAATVCVGDEFFGGAQLWGRVESGVIRVEPHVLRRVCVNGASRVVEADAGVYARRSAGDVEGDLEAVVELGFSRARLKDLEADLVRATQTPMPRLSDLRAGGLLRIDDALAAAIAS